VTAAGSREERGALTRRLLLEATIACLVEQGYAATTTTAIAERAGVSRGAQLHHFPTKALLVGAAVTHLARGVGRTLEADAERLAGDPGRTGEAIGVLWDRFSSPLFPAWVELVVAARTDPELRRVIVPIQARLRTAVDRQLRALFGAATDDAAVEGMVGLTFDVLVGISLERVLDADEPGMRRPDPSLEVWTTLATELVERRAPEPP
jgi:AcrR family transcriptional regulator